MWKFEEAEFSRGTRPLMASSEPSLMMSRFFKRKKICSESKLVADENSFQRRSEDFFFLLNENN